MITTTLAKIREHGPCASGWRKLLAHLGKTKADDEPLALLTILDSNGLDDAIWSFRTLPEHSATWRHYTVDCVERVKHLIKDPRSLEALRVARLHADGLVTDEQLEQARKAADTAADTAATASSATYAATAATYAATAAYAYAYADAYADATAAATAATAATTSEAAIGAAYAASYAAAIVDRDAERKWQANRLREYLS